MDNFFLQQLETRRILDQMIEEGTIYITKNYLMKLLGVSKTTIENWIRQAELPSYKIQGSRRFKLKEVEEWISSHKAA